MSTKRILIITILGTILIAAALGTMLLTPALNRESAVVELPDTPVIIERPIGAQPDELYRIEVNRETIQDVVSTLLRPETYRRNILIESFWDGGQAAFNIDVSVSDGITSLSITPPMGAQKRIIVTPDNLYIWYYGDTEPFVGQPDSIGDHRTADEWQMLPTFESVIGLDRNYVVDGGYVEFAGELCIFVLYRSPLLNNLRKYYISLDLGLVIAVEEHDSDGMLIYRMTAGQTIVGDVNPEDFMLPDRTLLIAG